MQNEVIEQPEVVEAQQDEGQQATTDAQDGAQEAKAKAKENGAQKRIDELTRQRHEAQREATYWREVANKPTEKESAPEKPKRDSFGTDDEYVEALAEHKAALAVEKALSERDKQQAQRAQQSVHEVRFQTYGERLSAVRAEIDDFDEAIESAADIRVSQAMQEAIVESELGPRISYHLAKNPDEARRIAALGPVAAALAIGKLEASLASEDRSKPVTKAPNPINPTRGSGGQFVKNETNMSDAEWYAGRKKR